MNPIITAFEQSPDEGQGQARDMRVRWALEEVEQAYDVRLVSFEEMKGPAHRALNPFGKIPTYEEGALALFESGAIIFHIAERHAGLLPRDRDARARAIAWMFAALNTVEPPIVEREAATILEKDHGWYQERMPILDQRVHERLAQLSDRLGDAEWLDGEFSAGDLLMVTVLRRLDEANMLDGVNLLKLYPSLLAYVRRGEARPAFKRAFDAQLKVFEDARSRIS
ncbi:MAG TPA: glutathione S-transferase family protein [Allosphingosinicella sp.]|jgi:glutathione S-transferase